MNKIKQPYTNYKLGKQTVLTKWSCLSQSKNKEENTPYQLFLSWWSLRSASNSRSLSSSNWVPCWPQTYLENKKNMKINLSFPTERQHDRVIEASGTCNLAVPGLIRSDNYQDLFLGGPLEFRYYVLFINNQLVVSCWKRFLILVCYT